MDLGVPDNAISIASTSGKYVFFLLVLLPPWLFNARAHVHGHSLTYIKIVINSLCQGYYFLTAG